MGHCEQVINYFSKLAGSLAEPASLSFGTVAGPHPGRRTTTAGLRRRSLQPDDNWSRCRCLQQFHPSLANRPAGRAENPDRNGNTRRRRTFGPIFSADGFSWFPTSESISSMLGKGGPLRPWCRYSSCSILSTLSPWPGFRPVSGPMPATAARDIYRDFGGALCLGASSRSLFISPASIWRCRRILGRIWPG